MHMSSQTALANSYYADGEKLSRAGRHHDAIGKYEQALAAAPNDVRVLFALGNTAKKLGLAGPAEQFFRQVLALEPERLEALINLANLLRANGVPAAAIQLLNPALARNPEAPELLLTIGSAHREQGDSEKAAEFYREALAQRPNYPEALGNLADLLSDAGQVDEAIELYDRAIKSDGSNAQARLNRAILHLLKGNLKDGWRDYAARLKLAHKTPATDHRLPRWNGEPLKKKRLLVTAEQGVGDQIMFASVFPDLIARANADGAKIILECEPRLVSLFQRSFPDAIVHASDIENKGGTLFAHYGWLKQLGGANVATEMGSLLRLLRNDIAAFPTPHRYLVPEASEAWHWQATLQGSAPRIGICWRSGKTKGLRGLQYAPLESWADLISRLPGTPVCAQYDATKDEIAELERRSGRTIIVPEGIDQKNELDRTVALFSAFDAMISAPTAVSWLSAASGIPTFKVLRDTSWTRFGQSYEPFAPSCECVGAKVSGDWQDALDRVARAISLRFSA
jgi:tetratricopeptide (TPR) repeat protein